MQGKSAAEIARDLGTCGPTQSTISDIISRFENRQPLTGRGRERRRDRALQGDDLSLFRRTYMEDPVTFLEELQSGQFEMTVRGRKVSVPVLCITMRDAGIILHRLYTLAHQHCELKRVMFWRRYHNGYTIDMLMFTGESGVNKRDAKIRKFQRQWRGCRSPNSALDIEQGWTHTMIPVMSMYGVLDWKVLRAETDRDSKGTSAKHFKKFVRECIVPHLHPYPQAHSVVVMNRASIHFRPDIFELIERHGARVLPLVPYSTWDNAVEYLLEWVREWLERNDFFVGMVGGLRGVDTAFKMLPNGYARRVIEHCGY